MVVCKMDRENESFGLLGRNSEWTQAFKGDRAREKREVGCADKKARGERYGRWETYGVEVAVDLGSVYKGGTGLKNKERSHELTVWGERGRLGGGSPLYCSKWEGVRGCRQKFPEWFEKQGWPEGATGGGKVKKGGRKREKFESSMELMYLRGGNFCPSKEVDNKERP